MVFQLNNLRILSLSGNNLTTIPNDVCNLKSLVTLNLSSNKISGGSLSCLTGLERLYLNNNELTNLPSGITEMQSLKLLYLFSNKLTTLDEKLAKLTNLDVLFIQFNKIVEEPNIFRQNLILNYTFVPQNINAKQLYKYTLSPTFSLTVSEGSMNSQEGLKDYTSSTREDLSKKKSGPWPQLGAYYAQKVSFGNFNDLTFISESEVGFGKSAIGLFLTPGAPLYFDLGLYYKRYFRDMSYRLRPYAKVGLAYDVDNDGSNALGPLAKAGVDFYPVKFFGFFAEAGYYRNGFINVGITFRLNSIHK